MTYNVLSGTLNLAQLLNQFGITFGVGGNLQGLQLEPYACFKKWV